MKLNMSIVICALLVFISSVAASPRIGQRPEGICTRDLNSWGHASHCSCANDLNYDERSGLCLKGIDAERITVQGAVSTGMMAIGGETTGFVIETPENQLYELILKTADQEKLNKLSGMWFEITGELITTESVELKKRKVLIADRIAVLE